MEILEFFDESTVVLVLFIGLVLVLLFGDAFDSIASDNESEGDYENPNIPDNFFNRLPETIETDFSAHDKDLSERLGAESEDARASFEANKEMQADLAQMEQDLRQRKAEAEAEISKQKAQNERDKLESERKIQEYLNKRIDD